MEGQSYTAAQGKGIVCGPGRYTSARTQSNIPTHCLPANVMVLPGDQILRREIGPPLTSLSSVKQSFWSHLQSMGGEWMWEHIVEGDINVGWIRGRAGK